MIRVDEYLPRVEHFVGKQLLMHRVACFGGVERPLATKDTLWRHMTQSEFGGSATVAVTTVVKTGQLGD